jgi:hypothetical protein
MHCVEKTKKVAVKSNSTVIAVLLERYCTRRETGVPIPSDYWGSVHDCELFDNKEHNKSSGRIINWD